MTNIKNYIPHKKLNPKLWNNFKLKKEIRTALLKIADNFIEDLGVDIDYDDITLTGSLSNFNYTPFSDIDLHVVFDFDNVLEIDNEDLAKEFFNTKKNYWNNVHDINIKNIEVEIYPQNISEKHVSTGVYSVLRDEWINKPKKFINKIDKDSIISKFKKIEKEIKLTIEESEKENDIKYIERFIKKIKKMRKSGLEKSGELSDENIIYKLIRDEGYLQNLFDKKNSIIDDLLSFN